MGLTGALLLAVVVASCRTGGLEPSADTSLFGRIDGYVQQEVDASRMPGVAVAIVQGGDVVHQRGFGHDGNGRPVTPGTPFPIGSLTKSFTALAIRQLSEAGTIGLDDPVQRHIAWFRVADADASSRITVRHLLNQTSGFSRASGLQPLLDDARASLEDLVRSLASTPLNRPVGQSYEYSNLNFVVLGLLVETIAGQSWGTYIEQRIFAPLGMTHSFTTFDAAERMGMTALHRYWFGVPVRSALEYQPELAPAGYLVASVDDMARYLTVFLDRRPAPAAGLLSAAGIEGMLTPATNEVTVPLLSQPFTARYGEGWFVGPFGAAPDARWHLGELPSFAAWMVLLPESNQGVVVLTNIGSQMAIAGGNSALSRLPQGIVNILRELPPPAGISVTRFYVLFDVAAVAVLAALAWYLVRLPRSDHARATSIGDGSGSRQPVRNLLALGAGLGAAALILLGAPAMTGTNWTTMWQVVPDLTLVLLALAILSAACGIMRAVRGAGLLTSRRLPTR
jgi:CubicO group peptidase (beta-lactamase class C family)